MKRILAIVHFCVIMECAQGFLTPVVKTSYGKVRGLRNIYGQNQYFSIPYAVSKRFQPPQEPPSWTGVYIAIPQITCAQKFGALLLGSEDCLRLNVFTPVNATPGQKLPVLAFIHGGGYSIQSSHNYDPQFLSNRNVISVLMNYRLGVLGFLCINGVANLGLKDQVAALKWIQKNIAAFGGDPDNVTLGGESAGASCATMHLLSESSKGLFHKAIAFSGNALAPWALNPEPQTPVFMDVLKRKWVTNAREVYDYFATAPLNEVLSVAEGTLLNTRYFKYSPCVDSNFSDPFFLDTPYNIIKSGSFNKVPILAGMENTEGLVFSNSNTDQTLEYMRNHFTETLPSVFSWCSEEDKREIAQKLYQCFFGQAGINKSAFKNLTDFYSSWFINATADSFVHLMVKYSGQPLYNFVFSYEGYRNFPKFILGRPKVPGATHGDELFYLFKPFGWSEVMTNRDKLFSNKLSTMTANFIKYGDPTPTKTNLLPVRWPPVSANHSVALRLDEEMSVITTSRSEKAQFFLNLLCTYGQEGYVPCESQKKCNLNKTVATFT